MSDDDKLSAEAKAMRQTMPAFNALTRLISATIAGTAIGYGLDRFDVTNQGAGLKWGSIIGAVVGLVVFIWSAAQIKTSVPPGPPPSSGDSPKP